MSADRETIQTLLDLLNPLHGELDRQTYDENLKQGFDAPDDAEYTVDITARMERDLTQAVLILENRLRNAAPDAAEVARLRAALKAAEEEKERLQDRLSAWELQAQIEGRLHGEFKRKFEAEQSAHAATRARLERMREALEKAAARFHAYHGLHLAKDTHEGRVKASSNLDMAVLCEAALLSTPLEDDGWLPIEGAPRDGTRITAKYEDGSTEDGVYYAADRQCMLGPRAGGYGHGWVSTEAGNLAITEQPTHWRDLPPPPKE